MTATFPFPRQAVLARRQLRLAVMAALKRAALVVGTTAVTMDSPGDWPYPQGKLPALCVRSATETKTSGNKKTTSFSTVVEIDVRAAVAATTAETAQDAIEALWYRIEQAILTDFYVLQLVQAVPTVESSIEVKADGQSQIAGAIGRYRFETFETFDVSLPDGSAQAASVPAAIVPLETVSIDLTSSTSDPPFSAQPSDPGLTLTLPGD